MSFRIIHVVPSTSPVGGIAKVLDYAVHTAKLGIESVFFALTEKCQSEDVLFKKPYFVVNKNKVKLFGTKDFKPKSGDVVFFSLPSNHHRVLSIYRSASKQPRCFIHLVQNVRHTNLYFDKGYAFRLLRKPMVRICITDQVQKEIEPWLVDKSSLYLVKHGFDFRAFANKPNIKDPFTIVYNTFKGSFGDRVIKALNDNGRNIKPVVVNKGDSWEALQNSYRVGNVFLGTPLREEGLYLPGLEAMASGCLVIVPNAYGNLFYTEFGDNAVEVEFENVGSYISAIDEVISGWAGKFYDMRCSAYLTAESMSLENECNAYANVLSEQGLIYQ